MSTTNLPRGPGLFEVGRVNGERFITNVRRSPVPIGRPDPRWCQRPPSCSACSPLGCSW